MSHMLRHGPLLILKGECNAFLVANTPTSTASKLTDSRKSETRRSLRDPYLELKRGVRIDIKAGGT